MSQDLKDKKIADIQRERKKKNPSRQRKEQVQRSYSGKEHGISLEQNEQRGDLYEICLERQTGLLSCNAQWPKEAGVSF